MLDFFGSGEFARWYMSLFEMAFGAVWIIFAPRLIDQSRNFRRELKDPQEGPRFRAVLQRRVALEKLSPWTWRIVGSIAFILGLITFFSRISPIVGYSLMCLATSIVMTFVLVRMRNRSDRRAAMLTPRGANAVVPSWVIGITTIMVLLPLVFVAEPSIGTAAAIVSLAGAGMVAVVSLLLTNMPSLLTGEDAEIEAYVDETVRRNRAAALMILTSAAPFVFMSMSVPTLSHPTQFEVLANVAATAGWVAVMAWFLIQLLVRSKERPRIYVA